MKVQIEIAAPDTNIWQAIDAPEPLENLGFEGSPIQQADAAAADYADTQTHEGAEPGMQVRALLVQDGETVNISDVHTVAEPPRIGRPPVGGTISTAIGTERLAAIDEYAANEGVKRAEAIRRVLDDGLRVAQAVSVMRLRNLWTKGGRIDRPGLPPITQDDLGALASQIDTDDDGFPLDDQWQVLADQLNTVNDR